MTEQSPRTGGGAEAQTIVATKAIRDRLVAQIITAGTAAEEVYYDNDHINPETRVTIFNLYTAHISNVLGGDAPLETPDVEIGEQNRSLLSLADIAREILPVTYNINDVIAKETVSIVARRMYASELRQQIIAAPAILAERVLAGRSLDECVVQETKIFNKQRMALVAARIRSENLAYDPDYYQKLHLQGLAAQGRIVWSDEEFAELERLMAENRWPEGSRHAGLPNWQILAGLMNEMYQTDQFTAKRLKDRYLGWKQKQLDA